MGSVVLVAEPLPLPATPLQPRLAAHWPMIEPTPGKYNFVELDYQIAKAEAVGTEVILAVGRRLPRWPECHTPTWAQENETV